MIELLIGIAVALFVTAAGTTLISSHLRQNRALLLESQLQHDVAHAAAVIERDLRRAGHWGAAASSVRIRAAVPALANPYSNVVSTSGTVGQVDFRYSRDAVENGSVDANEQFGFRFRGGTIELQLGADNWQALTDPSAVVVTRFSVVPIEQEVELGDLCPTPCPPTSATCPPRQTVRSIELTIAARSAVDLAVQRSFRTVVRIRNDALVGACGG